MTAVVRQNSKSRRRWMAVMFAAYLLGLLELGSRLYWTLGCGVPFFDTRPMEMPFYESLRESGVMRRPVSRDDGTFDVLLLGGSVLHPKFGDIGEKLERQLAQHTALPIRVYNLAEPGHTTRDSLLKYRLLDRQRFDLVMVYHGINDARQNNCSREKFQADYSHCGWYRKLAAVSKHPERRWLTLPYSIDCACVRVMESPAIGRFLPRDVPPGGWGSESEDIKTAETFEANLEELATTAATRGDPLVLMTFAHQAEKYLPYPHLVTGISAWGTPAGVLAALNEHNAATCRVAARHPEALFVDQEGSIPKTERSLTDPCHLTNEGCSLWVSNFANALRERDSAEASQTDVRTAASGVHYRLGSPRRH